MEGNAQAHFLGRAAVARMRVAVIGLGMASAPHAQSLKDLADRVEVAYGYSRTEARARAFGDRFGVPVTTDLDAIIADRSVQAVLILTPPASHLDLVERFAAAGKHILLEKPVELTLERATRLVETAERAGVTLGLVLQLRFGAEVVALRQRLAEGALGSLAAVSLAVPWWRPQSYYDEPGRGTLARDGGGVLITQAIHPLDLMIDLAGPVRRVTALTATTGLHRMETEDFCAAGLEFDSGAVGSLVATTAHYPGASERLDLIGTAGTASLARGTVTIERHDGGRETIGAPASGGAGADPMAFRHDSHRALIADFLDAIEQRRPPRISGREALKVHRLIEALLASSREGRAVTLPG